MRQKSISSIDKSGFAAGQTLGGEGNPPGVPPQSKPKRCSRRKGWARLAVGEPVSGCCGLVEARSRAIATLAHA